MSGTRYLFAGLLVALIVSVVAITYLRIERQLRETLEAQLGAVLHENVHAVTGWIKSHESVAQSTAKLPEVVSLARSLSRDEVTSTQAKEVLLDTVRPLLETGVILRASLDGPEQAESVAVGRPSESTEPAWRTRTPRTKSTRLLRQNGEIVVETIVAIVDARKEQSGYLSLTSDSKDSPLYPRAFFGGATYFFDRDGVLGGASRNAHFLPPGAATASSADGKSSHGTADYLGVSNVPVIGTFEWIQEYQLGVATEVPQGEALGSIARLRRSFLVLVVLVGAAVLGFIALGRWTLRMREESLLMTRRLGRLARAIQPLSAALEHDPSAVVLVDADGTVVYANASSHRVLGVSSPLLGQEADEVFDNLHAELHAALVSGRDSIVAQGTADDDETLLVSSRNLTIDGNPHYLYMLRPVTQQVRRQEVEHWKKLIRVLSHELNNALAPITSLLSSARKVNQMSHQDQRLGEIFERIAERTAHLVSFIEGYREVARLPRPDQRETDWEVFMDSLASQKRFRRETPLPRRAGYFDPVQLERVLINVLNNSYEAGSDPDDVTVEVTEEPGGFRINVADRGSGMPEPVLKQAMLPFFSTKRTGTGVGLALSREIIEAHSGQLTLANRDGGGLIVSCFLPHPIQPAPHPSRSRLPLSPATGLAHDDSDAPGGPT